MLIINGTVFNGKTFEKGTAVRIRNGVIAETGKDLAAEAGEEQVDLQGDYLLPGFVDVHIHAYLGSDTMRGEANIRKMSRDLGKAGTAAFCPTTMSASAEDTKRVMADIRKVMAEQENGAKVLGAHMEAPFLSEGRAGAQMKEYFRDPDCSFIIIFFFL